jgi:hypothetical protein
MSCESWEVYVLCLRLWQEMGHYKRLGHVRGVTWKNLGYNPKQDDLYQVTLSW